MSYNPASNIFTFTQDSTNLLEDLYNIDIGSSLTLMASTRSQCFQRNDVVVVTNNFQDQTPQANENTVDDMQLVPINSLNDECYWGNEDRKFAKITLVVTRAGVGTWTVTWQYSTATGWATLTVTPSPSNFGQFKTAGIGTISFTPPSAWAKRTVNGINAYWVRAKVTVFTSVATAPLGGQSWLHYKLDYQIRPADNVALQLLINCTAIPDETRSPTATAVIVAGWANPINAYASDDTYTTSTQADPNAKQEYSTYGFNVLAGKTITAVILKLEGKIDDPTQADVFIRVWDQDAGIWVDYGSVALDTIEATIDVDLTYLTTWTPNNVNNIKISIVNEQLGVGNYIISIDSLQIYVQSGGGTITLDGTDMYGNYVSEDVNVNIAGMVFFTINYFRILTENSYAIKVTGEFTFDIIQLRLGIVAKYENQGVGDKSWSLLAAIQIGDGVEIWNVSFAIRQQIYIPNFTTTQSHVFRIMANSTLTAGTLIDVSTKAVKNGIQIYTEKGFLIKGEVDSIVYLYACSLMSLGTGAIESMGVSRIWGCSSNLGIVGANLDVDNLINIGGYAPFYSITMPISGTFNRITSFGQTYLALANSPPADITVKNAYVRNNASAYLIWAQGSSSNFYLINVDSDAWGLFATVYTGIVYRQYELDGHVIDKDNNPISGVIVVAEYAGVYGQAFSTTTNGNGNIPTQTVDHGFLQGTTTTETVKAPIKVTYRKIGYKTVVKYYLMTEKTKDIVVMHPIENKFDILEG